MHADDSNPILLGLKKARVVGVLRAGSAENAVRAALAAVRGGLRTLEITFTTPDAAQVIQELKTELPSHVLLGAGTDMNAEQARAAIEAGATFLVSPHLGEDVLEVARAAQVEYIPGVLTPTEIARAQWSEVLKRCESEPNGERVYLQQPGHLPTVRAWCDAVEIAHLFDATPPLLSKAEYVQKLQSFQDPQTGLIPDPWQPPQASENPWQLENHLERYHLLAVGYALELMSAKLLHPIYAVQKLDDANLVQHLEQMAWHNDAWMTGDWIDCYATAKYLNARHFNLDTPPYALFGWLHSKANAFTGVWGTPRAEDGWLQPVNGFYRLTRGNYAQFVVPVAYPNRTIDTILAHTNDIQFFGLELGNACNVLDVIRPLWLCGKQTNYRQAEASQWATTQLERISKHWIDGQGFSFDLEPANTPSSTPSLQGTEMWLAITYLLAEYLGISSQLGYTPEGVHRLPVAWQINKL